MFKDPKGGRPSLREYIVILVIVTILVVVLIAIAGSNREQIFSNLLAPAI